MIVVQSENAQLTPLILCDFCHQQLQGPHSGYALLLVTRLETGQGRTADLFFAHVSCEPRFQAQNPAPPGARWTRANVLELLSVLVANTKGTAQTVPVVKRPRLH